MKKIIIFTVLVILGFSNFVSASSPVELNKHANKLEKLANLIFKKPPHHHHHHKCRECPPGPQGIPGPQGPIGPPGPTLSTFISLFALGQQIVQAGDPVLFDAVSAQNGPILWPGANNGEIIVSTEGIYQITFGIQPIFNARLSLQINNLNIPGGTLSIDLSIPFSGLTLNVSIPANSTISLVNTGISPIIFQSAGPDPDATIAFIEIHKIL